MSPRVLLPANSSPIARALFRAATSVVAAAAAAVAACNGADVAGPPPAPPTSEAARRDSVDRLVDDAEVVVRRVTNLRARSGRPALRSERTWVALPQDARRKLAAAGPVGLNVGPSVQSSAVQPSTQAAGATTGEALLRTLDRLAPPLVTLPAQFATSVCASPARTEHTAPTAVAGTEVRVVRDGDGPPRELTLLHGGQPVAKVTFLWVRRAQSWELLRQETSTPQDGVIDLVTIERKHDGRALPLRGLPTSSCLGGSEPAPAFGAVAFGQGGTAAGASPARPFSAEVSATGCGVGEGPDPCGVKRRARDLVIAEYIQVAAIGYVACIVAPPPVNLATCAGALAAIAPEAVKVRNAVLDVRDCEAEAREAKRQQCRCAVTSKAGADGPQLAATRSAVSSAAPGARPATNTSICDLPPGEPEYPPPPPMVTYPVGGDGGTEPSSFVFDGGGGFTILRVCSYTDYYAGDGTFLYTASNGCTTSVI